jgi:hypothetical protein
MKNSAAYALPAGLTTHSNLPAPTGNVRSVAQIRHFAMAMQKVAAAITLSCLAAWCVTSTVGVMFDFGYEAVQSMFGQPDSNQGVFAGMALWFVVMPFSFALTFGYARRIVAGPSFWNGVPALIVVGLGSFILSVDSSMDAMVEMIPWFLVACTIAYAGYFVGQNLMRKITDETSRRLIAAGVIACVPCGVLSAFSIDLSYKLEIALCAATLLSAATFVAGRCKTRSLSARLKMVSLAMLPIFIPLTLNVTGCMVSLFADCLGIGVDLGWRAAVSAVCLLIFATANAAIGTGVAQVLHD